MSIVEMSRARGICQVHQTGGLKAFGVRVGWTPLWISRSRSAVVSYQESKNPVWDDWALWVKMLYLQLAAAQDQSIRRRVASTASPGGLARPVFSVFPVFLPRW